MADVNLVDLTPAEVGYKIGDRTLTLCEAGEGVLVSFMDRLAAAKATPAEDERAKRMAGLDSELLSLCLFEDGKLLSVEEVLALPSRAVKAMSRKALEINGLSAEKPDAPKERPGGLPGTSS